MSKRPSKFPPGDNSDDLQTTEEIAAYLKVDPKTVYN